MVDPVIPDQGISLEGVEKAYVVKALEKRVAKGKITQADMDGLTSMIQGTSSYGDLITQIHRTADGLLTKVQYGDLARARVQPLDRQRRLGG